MTFSDYNNDYVGYAIRWIGPADGMRQWKFAEGDSFLP
jgi:hypothetical protein